MNKIYIFIIVLLLSVIGGGYYLYNKQKQDLIKLKLDAINSKILIIDTLGIKLDTLNPFIKITSEDIQRQKMYLDTLERQLKHNRSSEITIDSALKILKNL